MNIALNYGFKNELISIFNKLVEKKIFKINDKDFHLIKKYSFLGNIPDVDILIRTGGYQRLSNFILLNLTYSELFFTKILWPEIREKDFVKIFDKYKDLIRNYGL